MPKRCYGCMKLKEQSPVCELCGYNENVPNYPHQLPVGTVLYGQYTVGKVLGQGGFGITYIGWDNSLETPVAIKEYYPASFVNRDCGMTLNVSCNGEGAEGLFAHNRERFLKEAKILAKLSSVPGIVRVQNLFAENNTAYIVMEYVEGIDLKHYIRMQNRVLTVQEMFHVLRPVMYALSKVHEAELVHRDISPDNIMIQKDGSAKLLDFGAAREVENADVNTDPPQSTEAILKHGFAPMEQYRRRGSLGPWTDVYALCATMYYCMTGKVPNSAPERVMGDDNVNWRQIPGLTEQQIQTLEKGLSLMPENRIRTMRELHTGLFGQTATGFTQVQKEEPKKEPEKRPEKKAEKKPDYPTHTISLESDDTEANRRGGSSTLPKAASTEQKKKKPFGMIAAALAIVAAVGVFALKPKGDGDIAPTDKPLLSETEPAIVVTLSPEELQYQEAEALAAEGKHAHAGIAFAKLGDYADARERSFEQWSYTRPRQSIDYEWSFHWTTDAVYYLFLQEDGTAIMKGPNAEHCRNVEGWTDLIGVCMADQSLPLGLKSDGTVVCGPALFLDNNYIYDDKYLAQQISTWTDIIYLHPTWDGVLGLTRDGTVEYASWYDEETSSAIHSVVSTWTDIVSLPLDNEIVGLRADGSVVAFDPNGHYGSETRAGNGYYYNAAQSKYLTEIQTWTNIVSLKEGIVGICADGTVMAAGSFACNGRKGEFYGRVDGLTDVVDVSDRFAVKSDGTVSVLPLDLPNELGSWESYDFAEDEIVTSWTDIVAIYNENLGLKADGTVVCSHDLNWNRDISDWTDIVYIDTFHGKTFAIRSDGSIVDMDSGKGSIEKYTDGIRFPLPLPPTE